MHGHEISGAFGAWLTEFDWELFVTLNLNTTTTVRTAERYFHKFCQKLDRRILGRRWDRHRERRTLIIGVPEHLHSNFHFHCLMLRRGHLDLPMHRVMHHIEAAWPSVVKSGTSHFRTIEDLRGLTGYLGKETWKRENYNAIVFSP